MVKIKEVPQFLRRFQVSYKPADLDRDTRKLKTGIGAKMLERRNGLDLMLLSHFLQGRSIEGLSSPVDRKVRETDFPLLDKLDTGGRVKLTTLAKWGITLIDLAVAEIDHREAGRTQVWMEKGQSGRFLRHIGEQRGRGYIITSVSLADILENAGMALPSKIEIEDAAIRPVWGALDAYARSHFFLHLGKADRLSLFNMLDKKGRQQLVAALHPKDLPLLINALHSLACWEAMRDAGEQRKSLLAPLIQARFPGIYKGSIRPYFVRGV